MIKSIKVLVSARLKTLPWIFFPIAKIRENFKRRVVTAKTDIVIDGYWRSGNHYATYAFIFAQQKKSIVAHHFHSPSQFILAVRWNVPAVLLIRDPIDAVSSATIFLGITDPRPLLRCYNIFYNSLLHLKDQIIVSDFPTTVKDFGSVVNLVNEHYQRDFILPNNSYEEDRVIKKYIRTEHIKNMGDGFHTFPLPSTKKYRLKQTIIKTINSPKCYPLLTQSKRLYQEFQAVA
jgi:hypothetical protein